MTRTRRVWLVAAAILGLGVDAARAQTMTEMMLNIQCLTPSAPAGDQGADCSKYDGLNRTLRITFHNAQNPLLFQETRLQSFNFNSIRAYLDGDGDPNTFAVIYRGTNSILNDPGLRVMVEILSNNGSYGLLLDVPFRPEGYSLWALHSNETPGLESQITALQSTVATNFTTAKSYADTNDAAALASAKQYADAGDAIALTSAKSYCDLQVASETATLAAADDTLETKETSDYQALAAAVATLQSNITGSATALENTIAAIYSGDLTVGSANVIGTLALPVSRVVGIFGYVIDAPDGFVAGDVPVLAPSGSAFVPSGHAAIHAETITATVGLVASTAGDSDSVLGECSEDFFSSCHGVHGKGKNGVLGEASYGVGVEGKGSIGVEGTAGPALDELHPGTGVQARAGVEAGSMALQALAADPRTIAASLEGAVNIKPFFPYQPFEPDRPLLEVGAVASCKQYGGPNSAPLCIKSTSATFDGPIVVQRDGDPAFGSVDGATGTSAFFVGTVNVGGDLNVAGGKHFRIDHPLDPGGKYLVHTSVESPDMKNMYDGLATLDAKGEAVIALPSYFEALNRDFRYQLTAVGAGAPGLHVAAKVTGNRFRIAGGPPGLEVSWQVTGIRHDAYAEAHTAAVEQAKAERDRGRYLYPEGFGRPRDQAIAGR